jgi:hypothetical protein
LQSDASALSLSEDFATISEAIIITDKSLSDKDAKGKNEKKSQEVKTNFRLDDNLSWNRFNGIECKKGEEMITGGKLYRKIIPAN